MSTKKAKSQTAKEIASIITHARKQPGFKEYMKAFMEYHTGVKSN